MEAPVLSYVIVRDILVSAESFYPFNSSKILNEKEFLNQEINMQYKLHIKAMQMILVILAGIPLLRVGYFWQLLPPNQPWSVPEVGLSYFIIKYLSRIKYEQVQKGTSKILASVKISQAPVAILCTTPWQTITVAHEHDGSYTRSGCSFVRLLRNPCRGVKSSEQSAVQVFNKKKYLFPTQHTRFQCDLPSAVIKRLVYDLQMDKQRLS